MRRAHVSRVPHVRWIHQHLVRVVAMVLGHGRVVVVVLVVALLRLGQAMGCTTAMMEGGSWVLMGRGIKAVLLLVTLIDLMRVLCRVIDIVVPYPVMARQRASNAWVPPERTALDGRRNLKRKNWLSGGPLGLRWTGVGGLLLFLLVRRCVDVRPAGAAEAVMIGRRKAFVLGPMV